MRMLKFLLYPFSWLYGVVIAVRNFLFDKGLLPSKEFHTPVISVGNLAVGGTGKRRIRNILFVYYKPLIVLLC